MRQFLNSFCSKQQAVIDNTMEHQETVDGIRQKRLIFTVTTGRSGTAYLASLFGFARGVYTVHEPAPEFADVLRPVQNNPDLAHRFLLEEKLPAILRISAPVYIETSHLACKGFLEPLLELGIVPDLIIHRRPARDVARSMLKMGTIPGRTDKGLRFYLSPDDPRVLALSDWQNLHDYQLCYWYCLELERRALHYQQVFEQAGARIAETTLSDLRTFVGLARCFADLDLKIKFPAWLTRLRFLRSSGVKVNQSMETKKNVQEPGSIDDLELEISTMVKAQALSPVGQRSPC